MSLVKISFGKSNISIAGCHGLNRASTFFYKYSYSLLEKIMRIAPCCLTQIAPFASVKLTPYVSTKLTL